MKKTKIVLLFAIVLTVTAINIPLCSNGAVSLSFKDTNGTVDTTTWATLCHDKKSLFITWDNADDQIISTFTECNDPLYK